MSSSIWDKTYQVCVVVRDMEKAIKYYEALGIGPFLEGPSAHAVERRIYGKDAPDAKVIGRIAKMGPIEFELLQPVSGNTIQQEFLDKHGEGAIHLCGYTDDLQSDIAEMKEKGCDVISYASFEGGAELAYFETREIGGLILELYQPGKPGSKWDN